MQRCIVEPLILKTLQRRAYRIVSICYKQIVCDEEHGEVRVAIIPAFGAFNARKRINRLLFCIEALQDIQQRL